MRPRTLILEKSKSISIKNIAETVLPRSSKQLKKLKYYLDDFLFKDSNKVDPEDLYKSILKLQPSEKILSLKKKVLISYKSQLQTFIEVAKRNGVKPVLMTQANRLNIKPELNLISPQMIERF